MKKLFSILVMLLLAVGVVCADPISKEQALQKAMALLRQLGDQRQLIPIADGQRLSRQRRAVANQLSEYYVFNKGTHEGFVIVSGDDRTESILGYADVGDFDYDLLPPAMQELLDNYVAQIAALQQVPADEWAASSSQRRASTVPTHPKVAQLMTCTWNQRGPYNNLCPKDKDGNRSVTGCVATAMAQILYYHREKMVTETQAPIPSYETWSHNIKVDGIPEGSPLDWDNMKDNGGSSSNQMTAVAQLMLYCGVSVHMDYTSGSSGAQIGEVPNAMINYFGMNTTARHIWKNDMSDVEWDALVYNDLSAGRPVYMGGYTGDGSVGHAFVCDGYDGNRRYHINWGWGGSSDGYYILTNLTPGQQGAGGNDDGHGYSTSPNIVIGIEPMNYSTRAISFSDMTARRLCIASFDLDGDGTVTYGEVAEVKDLGTVFQGQRILQFPELYYFTGLESIAADAFKGCTALTMLRLPKGLKTISKGAFSGCAKLTSLTLPDGMTVVDAEAFDGCKVLKDMTLPETLTAIGDAAFRGCTKLEEITLPIGLRTLGAGAFSDCSALTCVALKTFSPAAIMIGDGVFEGCQMGEMTLSVMQGTEDWVTKAPQWRDFGAISVERELSEGKFVEPVSGETYYLYHIGTGQYLTKGEAYGTQAVVGKDPMRFMVRQVAGQPEGIYYLRSDDTGNSGKYFFRTAEDGQVGKGVNACFVDGTSLNAKSYWQIQRVADSPYGDAVFTIQVPPTASDIGSDCYLGVQTNHKSNAAQPTYGVYPDIVMSGHETGCLWRFVRYDETVAQKTQVVNALANLLIQARKRGLKTPQEQAVYDNIQSTIDDMSLAQRSLRRRMNMVHFVNTVAQQTFVDLGDTNSDGELSFTEAAVIKDLNVSFKDEQTLTSLDALRYFTNLTSIPEKCFLNCKNLSTVTLASADPTTIRVTETAFSGVVLANCTLRVPMGSEEIYRQANVWKNFGHIVGYRTDPQGLALEKLLATVAAAGMDTSTEQAVYDAPDSSADDIAAAITSLRQKMNYIDFTDAKAQAICVENWDTTLDGELTYEEAAAVTDIGKVFQNVTGMSSLEVLRYFTGLKEIPTYAFRNAIALKTVFVPSGVNSIGELAFTGCNELKYLVVLNDKSMVPQQLLALPSKGTTLFVPLSVLNAYSNDSAWTARCFVTEYTGHPVVTAEASRQYSFTSADVAMRVMGAPVEGEAAFTCPEISVAATPVGSYPISVGRGTITNADVELHDGTLTITPVTIKVTAKSYTRNVGEPNPEFEVTYVRFRNHENASVLIKQPVISCEATIDSPAGIYPITVSGAEAQNYVFTYVDGTLTVIDPTGVNTPKDGVGQSVFYDLQGRRVMQPQRGLYIRDGRKIIVR